MDPLSCSHPDHQWNSRTLIFEISALDPANYSGKGNHCHETQFWWLESRGNKRRFCKIAVLANVPSFWVLRPPFCWAKFPKKVAKFETMFPKFLRNLLWNLPRNSPRFFARPFLAGRKVLPKFHLLYWHFHGLLFGLWFRCWSPQRATQLPLGQPYPLPPQQHLSHCKPHLVKESSLDWHVHACTFSLWKNISFISPCMPAEARRWIFFF